VVVVFLGPPGSGKGTQAARLREDYGFVHFDTGKALRDEAASGSDFGNRIAGIIDSGNLVPIDVIRQLVVSFVAGRGAERLLFDGFPRNTEQAEVLEAALAELGVDLDHAIYINLGRDALLERIVNRWMCSRCGAIYNMVTNPPRADAICNDDGAPLTQRKDDTPEVFSRRLEVYLDQTVPVLEHYRELELLREVNGAQAVDEVTQEILRLVGLEATGDVS
jgi:adenylate kinase